MKVSDEMKDHINREIKHVDRVNKNKKKIETKISVQPIRDDRGEHKPWRPGLKK